MNTRRIAGCVLAAVLAAAVAAQAQWERIPIQGGHFERLVKHPFKENELYGIVEQYGIYRSTDQGYTWANWMKSTPQRAWKNIYALTFAKDGTALMISDGYPYLSRDDGTTWTNIPGLFSLPAHRDCVAHVDTSGRITLFNNRSKSFLTSSDSCRSWTEFPVPSDIRKEYLIVTMDKDHPEVIFICGFTFMRISFDYGRTWRTSSMFQPFVEGIVELPRIVTDTPHLRLGTWVTLTPWPNAMQYYESLDSGFTWTRASITHANTRMSGSRQHSAFIPRNSMDMFMLFHGVLYHTSDSGRMWEIQTDWCWDLAVYDNHMVGSFAMDGIKISTDSGRTWSNDGVLFPGTVSTTHFAVWKDTITAHVIDSHESLPSMHQLRQSSDRGLTWKTLFTTTSALDQLTVTSNPSLKYYVMWNKKALLRGGFGQEVPDTILTLERTPIQSPTNIPLIHLFVTDANNVYLSAPDIGLYWSTDGGDTWGRSGIPYGYFGFFRAVPSKENRDRLVASASAWDPMIPTSGGKFLTHNRGASWLVLDRADYPAAPMFYTGDTLYYTFDQLFSSDYGLTWFRNRHGVDAAFNNLAFILFENRGILFFGCDSAWYKYTGGAWTEILGPAGERLRDRMTSDAAIDGERLYVFQPYEGLYVTRSPTLTGIEETAGYPASHLLRMYPNPATDRAVILLPGDHGDPPEFISVTDVMGRHIRSIPIQSGERELSWDLTDDEGRRVRPGVYYLTASKLGAVTSKGTIIVN